MEGMLSPQDLADVFDRPWFRRGWTFQEVILASDITIMCGSTVIKWDVFVRGLMHLFDRSVPHEFYGEMLRLATVDSLKDLITVWIHFPRPMTKHREQRSEVFSRDSTISFYLSRGQKVLQSWYWLPCFPFLRLAFLLISWIHICANIHWIVFIILGFVIGLIIGFCLLLGTDSSLLFIPISVVIGSTIIVTILLPSITLMFWKSLHYWALDSTEAVGYMRWWYIFIYGRWAIQLKFGSNFTQGKGSDPRTFSRDASVNGMVRALRERQTKDPKDRSFATAAILSRLGIKLAKPDYSKELGEVYRNHFESLLRWDVGLLNLIVDVNRHHIPGVPSWVPMWNEVEKSNWIGAPSRYEHPAEKTSYQSGILHHDTLVVRGQLLGTVKFCSGPFPLIGPGVDDLLALSWDQWTNSQKEPILVAAFQFADWIRYAKNHVATIPRYEASMPELVSGILALRYRNDEPEKFIRRRKLIEGSESCSFKGEIFDSWYRRLSTIEPALLEMIKRERSEELHNNSQPQVFSIPEWDSTSNAVVREQTAKLCNLLSGKRNVFVLDLGYLGSGPEGMQENDEIYWIRGVSVPMVLRRSTEDSIFTVIGPAFVYGFMNRKMVKDNELVSITLG